MHDCDIGLIYAIQQVPLPAEQAVAYFLAEHYHVPLATFSFHTVRQAVAETTLQYVLAHPDRASMYFRERAHGFTRDLPDFYTMVDFLKAANLDTPNPCANYRIFTGEMNNGIQSNNS